MNFPHLHMFPQIFLPPARPYNFIPSAQKCSHPICLQSALSSCHIDKLTPLYLPRVCYNWQDESRNEVDIQILFLAVAELDCTVFDVQFIVSCFVY